MPSVDLRALQAFVTVCETTSMTEAARLLGVTQSAVSQLVKALEIEQGVALLDRDSRPLRPNAAGRTLLEKAGALLEHAHAVSQSVREASGGGTARLRIGCVDSFAATVGPALVNKVLGSVQNLWMWSGLTPAVSDQLVNRELDIAICTESTVDPERVSQNALFSEAFVAVIPRSFHPSRKTSFIDAVRELPLIRYSRRQTTAQQMERFIRHIGIDEPRRYEFDATDPIFSLVASGQGCAITTPLCLWQARHYLPDLVIADLPESPLARRHFFLLTRVGEWTEMAKILTRHTIASLKNEVAPAIRDAIPDLPPNAFIF